MVRKHISMISVKKKTLINHQLIAQLTIAVLNKKVLNIKRKLKKQKRILSKLAMKMTGKNKK